jgi:hypothetical protein
MNIKEQKKAVGDSYAVAAAALRGFQASQGLPIDSVDEIALQMSGADDCQLEVLNAFANLFDTLQRFQDELKEDKSELQKINDELRDIMHANGFSTSYQGGGCQAWQKDLMQGKDSPYVLISCNDLDIEFSAVEDADNDFGMCMNFYDAEGVPMTATHGEQYYNFWKFKALFGGEK